MATGDELFNKLMDKVILPLLKDAPEAEQLRVVSNVVGVFESMETDTLFDNVSPDSGPLWTIFKERYPADALWMEEHSDHNPCEDDDDELFDDGDDDDEGYDSE